MTGRYLLAEATQERDHLRKALEAVLETCDVADLNGVLLDPADVRTAISSTFADTWNVSAA